MGRPLRFIPPGSVVEVTIRTIHERMLMVPDRETTDLIAGVIGRAQARYLVRIHAVIVLSNHLQMLLSVRDAQQLAEFMAYVDGNIAREIGALRKWRQRFWGRRYRAIVVADSQAQVARLRYIFANSCKEGLVPHPQLWPGVSSARAFMKDEELLGTWVNRTEKRKLTRKAATPEMNAYSERYEIHLTPIPCLAHMSRQQYRAFCKQLITGVADEAVAERGPHGFIGLAAVITQDPFSCPRSSKHSPAPFVHASTPTVSAQFRELAKAFEAGFRCSSERLKTHASKLEFPDGSLLPGGAPAHAGSRDGWPPAFALDLDARGPIPIVA